MDEVEVEDDQAAQTWWFCQNRLQQDQLHQFVWKPLYE